MEESDQLRGLRRDLQYLSDEEINGPQNCCKHDDKEKNSESHTGDQTPAAKSAAIILQLFKYCIYPTLR